MSDVNKIALFPKGYQPKCFIPWISVTAIVSLYDKIKIDHELPFFCLDFCLANLLLRSFMHANHFC